MKDYKISYWVSVPGKWWVGSRLVDKPEYGSSNVRTVRTKKKAMKILSKLPCGSKVIGLYGYKENKGRLTKTWVKEG